MPDQPDSQPAKRGDALWKQQLEATAQRNAQASAKGKDEREKREQKAKARKTANEREQDAGLKSKSDFK